VTEGYVVVLFGDKADGWCTLVRCPLGAAEWFPTEPAARDYCASIPAGFEPHILSIRRSVAAPNPVP
jgi:hypothetical protein